MWFTRRREKKAPKRRGALDEPLTRQASEAVVGLGLSRLADTVRVVWNSRLRTAAGRAWPSERVIELNPRIGNFGEAEVRRTLLHELAHLVAHERAGRRAIRPHGIEWQQACADLGAPGESARHRLPLPRSRQVRRFLYKCPGCGLIVRRARRLQTAAACLSCCRKHAGGRFDDRFALTGPRE